MALDLPFVIIPLDCLMAGSKIQSRCYASDRLVEVLERIAGPGTSMLWWSEQEVSWGLSFDNVNWVWIPFGTVDDQYDHLHTNCMTHMKIFFKDPNHALLFKLSWS